MFYPPVQMKKNRPGTLVTVIAPPDRRGAVADVLFSRDHHHRRALPGDAARARWTGRLCASKHRSAGYDSRWRGALAAIVNAAPEFDDCAALAAERQVPVKEVQAVAAKAWLDRPATGD